MKSSNFPYRLLLYSGLGTPRSVYLPLSCSGPLISSLTCCMSLSRAWKTSSFHGITTSGGDRRRIRIGTSSHCSTLLSERVSSSSFHLKFARIRAPFFLLLAYYLKACLFQTYFLRQPCLPRDAYVARVVPPQGQ